MIQDISPPIERIADGGHTGLESDIVAVYDAGVRSRNGPGETMADIAGRVGVSRDWIYK